MKPAPQKALVPTDDDATANALRAFVCALGPAAAGVRLDFAAGVATLNGAVASLTQRRAVEDLVAAHDAVAAVASELRVVTPAPSQSNPASRFPPPTSNILASRFHPRVISISEPISSRE